MFLSKFVFVWVVDLLFGDNINMYGFFGILTAVAGVTIVHKLTDSTFKIRRITRAYVGMYSRLLLA